MKEIAIIAFSNKESYQDYGDTAFTAAIVESITEWTSVSDEEYRDVCNYAQRWYDPNSQRKITVIVKPPQALSIAAILELAKEDRAKRARAEQAKKDLAEKNRLKKLAKTEAQEKELFATLLRKYGSDIDSIKGTDKKVFDGLLKKYQPEPAK